MRIRAVWPLVCVAGFLAVACSSSTPATTAQAPAADNKPGTQKLGMATPHAVQGGNLPAMGSKIK